MTPLLLQAGLPLAAKWSEDQQRRILEEGIGLTAHQAFDAYLAGVKDPMRVRLLKVDFIPTPTDRLLRQANDRLGLVSPVTAGIAFGYGIYIRDERWGDRLLVAHELVHVGQYERYGSLRAFLRDYLEECLTVGYPNGSLEQEAISRAKEICE